MKYFLIITSIMTLSVTGHAQYISNLPTDNSNSRYYSDIFCKKRPCLTLNGFRNQYGSVDGILERYYQGDIPTKSLIEMLNEYSNDILNTIPSGQFDEEDLNENTQILQSRALICLSPLIQSFI